MAKKEIISEGILFVLMPSLELIFAKILFNTRTFLGYFAGFCFIVAFVGNLFGFFNKILKYCGI